MRSGTWNGAVSTDNVRVTVNGTVRPVKSVRVQSGMRDGHPASETSSWCIEATIEWADPKMVTADSPHVFGEGTDWLPQVGDDVVIETGDGALGAWWVQHRGVIDETTGSISDGTATSQTVDAIEELNKEVQYVALLDRMTPAAAGESFRWQGMHSTWFVERMLRDKRAGGETWEYCPPVTWQTLGFVPAIGSIRPDGGVSPVGMGGTLISSSAPDWTVSTDGLDTLYPIHYQSEVRLGDSTNELVLTCSLASDALDAEGELFAADDTGAGCFVRLTGTDEVRFGMYGATGAVGYSVPRSGATRAALYFKRTSTTDQTMTLRLDDGREFTEDTSPAGEMPANWSADRVLTDTKYGIGWWILEGEKPVAQRWASLDHVPTAHLRMHKQHLNRWVSSRDQPRASASTFIAEQADAECAAAWLDEDGHMQWWGRGVLEARPLAQTVAGVNLDGIDWSTRRRAAARSVTVEYLKADVDVDGQGGQTRVLWTARGIDLAPGEVETVVVTTPTDEDWIAEDENPHHVHEWGHNYTHYNHGSTFGGTQYRASSSDESAWCQFINCTMTRIGLRDYEVVFEPWSSISAAHRVNADWPPAATSAKSAESPTALRARARLTWLERDRSVSTGSGGPLRHVHSVGWRVQDYHGSLTSLINWMAAELADPSPTVTVQLTHDPRRQIGDKIRIEDPDITGVWIEMLVQERDTNVADFTDTIRGRVTAHGNLDDVSLPAPAGHTALTPVSNWNREVHP